MSLRAALIMFVAMSLIPAGDASGKLLTAQGISPVFVSWSRFVVGVILVAPFFAKAGIVLLGNWRIWLRGALLAGGITALQTALKTAPLADVFAAFFIGPIVSYVLAGVLLGERMTPLRSVLVALGFVGVLMVVRPGLDWNPGLGFALLAGLFYGAFLTASRWLSEMASPGALAFTQLGVGAVLLLPFGATQIPTLSLEIAGLTFTSAACSMLGNLILLYAYRIAPATELAPLVYFQLFAAVLLGWVIFADWPDAITWAGMALILGAGIAAARSRS
ncbi:MAG: DMT family transporter [Aliishimia sp.]